MTHQLRVIPDAAQPRLDLFYFHFWFIHAGVRALAQAAAADVNHTK